MAVYVWYGGGGNLDDPNLWSQPDPSNPSVPGAGGAADKAIISGAGTLAGSLYASILDLSGDFTLEGNISSDAILPFTGKLNIGSGGSLSGHFVNGYLQDDGTVDVSGTGSLFANTDIGYSGNGTITVENGGTVKADYFNVGVGSTGIATITGVGSSLSTADGGQYQNIEVGQNGTGTLIIADQALVATVGLEVAVNNAGAGVTDDLEVHGANLTVFQTLIVGMGGSANATFDVGANVGAQNIIVADLPDSTGEMDIRASATVSAGSLDVGAGASTNGTVVVDNSQLNITGNATIGDSGIGTLAVLNGGLVKVGGALTINSSSKVTIDGGTLELGTAVGSGPILFGPNVKDSSGHYPMLQIDSSFMPTNVISEFATGDEIDLTKLPLAALTSSGTVSEKPSAAPLTQVQIAANGTTDSLNLSESSAYDLAFKADGGSGSEFTVTKADATDATNEAGIVLDATKNFFKAVVALKSYRGLSVDEFNKVFGPVFAAVGAGTEANTIYQHLNAVLSSPNSTSAQIAAAWQTAVTDTVDVAVKFALATVIEEGTGAFAQAFLEAIAAFAPAGTVSEFFAVLATGGLVLEAPVIIGVGAVVGVSALLASPAFSSWYNTNIKERVGGW